MRRARGGRSAGGGGAFGALGELLDAAAQHLVQAGLGAVAQTIDLVLGQNLEAALGGDQGIHGGFSHRW